MILTISVVGGFICFMHHLDLLQGNLCCGGSTEEGKRTDQTHQEPRRAGPGRGEHTLFSTSLCPCVTDTVEPEPWKVFSQEHCGNVPEGFVREKGIITQLSSSPAGKLQCLATRP